MATKMKSGSQIQLLNDKLGKIIYDIFNDPRKR